MDNEFSRRMSAAAGKQRIIKLAKGKKVLDLGAGNGFISARLAEMGKDVTAVEIDPNVKKPEGVRWVTMDLCKFVDEAKERYDTIILSAVLHEIDEYDMLAMVHQLPSILVPKGRIIIREALLLQSDFGLLKANEPDYLNIMNELDMNPKVLEYLNADKKGRPVIRYSRLDRLNAAFAISYGEQSWEREKHELRFCHSLQDVLSEIEFNHLSITLEKDMSYKKWFAQNGLNPKILDYVRCTSMIVVIDK